VCSDFFGIPATFGEVTADSGCSGFFGMLLLTLGEVLAFPCSSAKLLVISKAFPALSSIQTL